MPDLSGTYTIESCTSYSDWVAFQTPVQGSTISNGQVATVYLAHPITGETTTPLYTTLEIVDDTAPVMTCSAVAVDVELTEDCAGWTLANADLVLGISDNCSPDGAIDRAYSHAENIVYPLTETTVQVTATDEAGNASSCSVNVTPVDVTAPEIICPSDVVLEFPEDGSNLILPELSGMASAVDCGIDLPTVASLTAGSEFTELEDGIVLTYTATDANGNSNSCTSTLSIVDTTSPDVAPIANQSVAVDANCLSVLPDFLDLVVATDLVSGIVDMVQEPAAGTVFGGELSVTITVQDGAGNSSSVDFIASATDQTPPTVSCPGMSWIELSDVCDYLVPDYTAEVTVLDNCSMSYTYSQSPEVGESIMPLNALQHIEVSVTDEAGNTGVCLAYIWINDGFAPEISCGEDLTFFA